MEIKLDIAEILNSTAIKAWSESNAGAELSNLGKHLLKTLSAPLCLINYVSYDTIPFIKDSLINLTRSLIEKAQKRNKTFSDNADTELICLALEGMKYNYYKHDDPRIEIFHEILFNILTTSKNDNLADYVRYISLIKNMFPLSLSLIHYIAKYKTLLLNININLKNNQNCLFPENMVSGGLDKDKFAYTSDLIMNNNTIGQSYFKYINDLESIRLISNYQIGEDNNNHEYYDVYYNNEQEKRTYVIKTLKTKTYQYYLLETGQYIYDNFYTDDVKNKIEKQNSFKI